MEASLLLILPLCCVLKRELVNGVIVFAAGRAAAAQLSFARSLCVCLRVCVSVLMVILENPDDLCLILYECA